jgi:1-phosphofructokinase family hexose kinase
MSHDTKIATVTLNPAIDQTVSVPNFKAGKVNRVTATRSDPGGKGVNVATLLADLGYPVVVTGFLGEENARIFERHFARKNIADRFVRIAGSTRTGIKIVDEECQETTDINFPGQAPAAADISALFRTVTDLAGECNWVVMSGSVPAGAPEDIYYDLVQTVRAQGARVVLDTSGEPLRRALAAAPAMAKPNVEELRELTGQALEDQLAVVRAAQSLLDQGLETVVVSMGADGALFVESQAVVLARPPKVAVKSTVGAGDAMVSGVVAGKLRGLGLADCARLATAFSLAAITRVERGLPPQAAIDTLMSQVDVRALDASR